MTAEPSFFTGRLVLRWPDPQDLGALAAVFAGWRRRPVGGQTATRETRRPRHRRPGVGSPLPAHALLQERSA